MSNYLYLTSDSYFTSRAAGPLGRRPARPSRNEWRAWLERHVVDAGEVEEHEVGVKAGEASRSEPTVTLAPRSSMARRRDAQAEAQVAARVVGDRGAGIGLRAKSFKYDLTVSKSYRSIKEQGWNKSWRPRDL